MNTRSSFYNKVTIKSSVTMSREEISEALIRLSHGIVYVQTSGICYNLQTITGVRQLLVQELSPFWSEFSGEKFYPVPDINGEYNPIDIYYHFELDNLWIGEYGEARKRLCRYLAKEVLHCQVEKPYWLVAAFNDLIKGN